MTAQPQDLTSPVTLLACVDTSVYASSVGEHAAWLADRLSARIAVLHASEETLATTETRDQGPWTRTDVDPVEAAMWRLRDLGVISVEGRTVQRPFPQAAAEAGADMVVMGKRGVTTQDDRTALGHSIDVLFRTTAVPICLAPKVYLPISRVLLLLDADMQHRRALDLLAAHPGLGGDEIGALVIAAPDAEPDAKAALALSVIGPAASIEVTRAAGLDAAVAQRMEAASADLIIVSRAVLLPAPRAQLRTIETRGLWGWRTPVLVC